MPDELLLARLPLNAHSLAKQPGAVADLPPELVAQANNPAVFEQDGALPFIETACASTSLDDRYATRMRPSSLQNYAADAKAGISIQNSHRTDELPLGRTFNGRYQPGTPRPSPSPSSGGARVSSPARTEMDFFIPPGLRVTDISTDDVIQAIEWGIVRDVSIGFYGGRLLCSLCGKGMLSGGLADLMSLGGMHIDEREAIDPSAPCHHVPGVQYARRDVHGKKLGGDKAIAIGEVEGAHCAELSFVFAGATPQAEIGGRRAPAVAKARRLEELDLLAPCLASELEQRYRGVRFAAARHSWPGVRKDTRRVETPAPSPSPVRPPAPVVQPPKLSRFQRLMTLAGRVR